VEENALIRDKPPCSCSDFEQRVEVLEDRLDTVETMIALSMGKKAGKSFFSRLFERTRHECVPD
jgi:hypothetical protein